MAFGTKLLNSNGEKLLTSDDLQVVYRGWLTPYFVEAIGASTTNSALSTTLSVRYLVPFLVDGSQFFFEEVNFLSGARNQIPVQTIVEYNTEGRTSLVFNSSTSDTTLTTGDFVSLDGTSAGPRRVGKYCGYPGVKAIKLFAWTYNGTPLSGNYDVECVLNVGDVVWSSYDPNNKVTITSIQEMSSGNLMDTTLQNRFRITFSAPLTFQGYVSGSKTTEPAMSTLCAQKLVNTMHVRACIAAPISKLGEWRYIMRVFTPISSALKTGYGMQVFDASGNALFDSNQSTLVLAAGVQIPSGGTVSGKQTYNVAFGSIPNYPIFSGTTIGIVSYPVSSSYDDNFPPWFLDPGSYGVSGSGVASTLGLGRVMGLRRNSDATVIADTSGVLSYSSSYSNIAITYNQPGNAYWLYADGNKYPIKSWNKISDVVSRGTTNIWGYTQDSDPPPSGWPGA